MPHTYRWVDIFPKLNVRFIKDHLLCFTGDRGYKAAILYCRPITARVANDANLLAVCMGGRCLSGGAADGRHELYAAQQSATHGVWTCEWQS